MSSGASDTVIHQEGRRITGSSSKQVDLTHSKVAIICDWLVGGGSEKVVLELHKMFPDAPIYTSYASKSWRRQLDGKVKTGLLQYWPFSKIRKFIPFLRILYFSTLRLKKYDLIISATGAEAKGVRTGKQQTHICYCYAPTHYYWSRYDEYIGSPGFGRLDWLARFGLKLLVKPLRNWDYKAAQQPDYMIAISTNIQKQIKQYYGRSSQIIHPPVDTDRFAIPTEKHGIPNIRKGFVVTGRQTPYKRIDLAVQACSELSVPLIVIGRKGPEHKRLKKLAGKTVTFLTQVSDRELPHHLQSAEAFIFPGKDDFGIAPVEAMAAGTPVIAYKAGGALEYVVEGKTGLFFKNQDIESLKVAIKDFQTHRFNETTCRAKAAEFSNENFKKHVHELLTAVKR